MMNFAIILVAVCVNALIVWLIAFYWGIKTARKFWQTEIVKRGFAHWKVADDGTTKFEWNEKGEK